MDVGGLGGGEMGRRFERGRITQQKKKKKGKIRTILLHQSNCNSEGSWRDIALWLVR